MGEILIRGMKMPKMCNGCDVNLSGHCLVNKGRYVGRENLEYDCKPDWCPLVYVAPHGRLIDADYIEAVDMEPWDAPTIIPASERMEAL